MAHYSAVVLTLNNVFILFPPVKGSSSRCFALFRCFSWLFLAFAAITGGPMSIIIKDQVFSNVATIHKAIYDVSAMLLFITNIYLSGVSILRQRKISQLLEEVLEDISNGSTFLINFAAFILIHLVNTLFILLTQLERTDNIWYQMTVFFVDGYMTFRLITGLFIIFLIINDAKNKMVELNEKLLGSTTATSIRHWRIRHNNLCDHLHNINSLFGVVLLLIIFYFITTFLRHAVFISVHSEANLVVAVRCLWIISYGFQAVYLGYMGEQIVKESQKTVAIGYKQICQWSCLKILDQSNEIFLLTQQAFNRTTRISAAGFFNVDNSMILFILTTFFTYFIVVTQLMAGGRKPT